jgi:hypothetical protein
MPARSISPERLWELFIYDPETGEFETRAGVRRKRSANGKIGHVCRKGYVQITVDGVNTYAHILAWTYTTGKHPAGSIDHINGVKTDNRFANLRDATGAINAQNVVRKPLGRFRRVGVYQSRDGGYRAEIQANGTRHQLGVYNTPEEAGAAYNAGRLLLHRDAIQHA